MTVVSTSDTLRHVPDPDCLHGNKASAQQPESVRSVQACCTAALHTHTHIFTIYKNGNLKPQWQLNMHLCPHKHKNILFMVKKGEFTFLSSKKNTYVTMLYTIPLLPIYFPFLLRLLICISSSLALLYSSEVNFILKLFIQLLL